MADSTKLAKAQAILNDICGALDADDWHYERDDEKLIIQFSARGEDLPLEFIYHIYPENQLVVLMSHLPFKIAENKRIDLAIVTSIINNKIVNGSFDLNVSSGTLLFRITQSYNDSVIDPEQYIFMLRLAAYTVDKYNDKFLMISKDMLSLEQFIQSENN